MFRFARVIRSLSYRLNGSHLTAQLPITIPPGLTPHAM